MRNWSIVVAALLLLGVAAELAEAGCGGRRGLLRRVFGGRHGGQAAACSSCR